MKKIYSGYKKFVNGYSKVAFILACVMIFALVLIVTYDVCLRYFLHLSTEWGYDTDGFLYVMICLLGLGYAESQKKHMSMDVISGKLKGKADNAMRIVHALLGLAYAFIMVYFGWKYAFKALITGKTLTTAWAPVVWPEYMALPVGFLGIGLQYTVDIIDNIIAMTGKQLAE